jgi:putative DNA primase/helicase
MSYDSIPAELKQLSQWVLWRFSKNEKGELTKKPYQTTGNLAKTNDKTTWTSITNVLLKAKNFDGIGFVFTENDDLVGIDLDKCVNNGVIEAWALEIIKVFENCYVEFSVSGKGIHIIFKGKIPDISDKRKGQIEIYDQGRYFCMTGNVYNGMNQIIEFPNLSGWLKSIGFIKENGNKPKLQSSPPSLTNDQIIQLARNAKNGAKFLALFNGNISEYSSASEADLAFVSLLSFYTQDKGQIVNIVQQTPLWDDKWERKDYQNRTVDKCLSTVTEIYKGKVEKTKASKTTMPEKQPPERKQESIEIRTFNITDYGNAERLVHYHGDNIRYCEAMKSWLIWDSKRWKVDENLEIYRLAKDVVRRIYNEAGNSDNEEQRKSIASHAGKSESANRLKNMVELAKSEIEVTITTDIIDKDGFLLNCQNGTIDLRTGELIPHRKSDYLTKIIPIKFIPDAECPRWELFLKEIFKDDKDLIRFIQYAVGYSLTGNIKEECLFLCYGKGRNGKSKFLDTLEFIFGDYGRNVDPSTFEEKKKDSRSASEDIARLKDARFISTVETGESKKLDETMVKQMTGNRLISARELYQKTLQFEQTYKIWIATNHKPIIKGTDDAIWERINLIPFEVYFTPEQRDANLGNKLMAEASGILNWMVEGCLLWQGCGLLQVTPEKVRIATGSYRKDMDILGGFINERCTLKEDMIVTKQMIYNQYCEWCRENGIDPESKIKFGRRLTENYNIYEKSGADNVQLWRGIGLKSLFE